MARSEGNLVPTLERKDIAPDDIGHRDLGCYLVGRRAALRRHVLSELLCEKPQGYSAIIMMTKKVITAIIGIDHFSSEMNPP